MAAAKRDDDDSRKAAGNGLPGAACNLLAVELKRARSQIQDVPSRVALASVRERLKFPDEAVEDDSTSSTIASPTPPLHHAQQVHMWETFGAGRKGRHVPFWHYVAVFKSCRLVVCAALPPGRDTNGLRRAC
ncbi:hypothetical protein LA080_002186 [Diaporthe eres]|nr:hypothetical protein LA080_002186 [Diaporthe eres]